MNDATYAALPDLCKDLAQGAMRTLTDLLEHQPDEPLQCCFVGNWNTDETEFIEFEKLTSNTFSLYAKDVRQKAKAIDADYVMTVLDMTRPLPRGVFISIETHDGSYVCIFPVIRKHTKGPALMLGPSEFEKLKKLSGPLSRLLPARKKDRCA